MRSGILRILGFAMLWSCSSGMAVAQSGEFISRVALIDMAKNQYNVLCGSDVFNQCMGFTAMVCNDLSDTAIEQCLMTLPEEINLEKLDNSALESCPKAVFENAGFSEEKAGPCFDQAMETEGSD